VLQLAPAGFLAATSIVLVSIAIFGMDPVHSRTAMFWTEGLRYTVLAVGFGCLLAWALRPRSVGLWFFELAPLRFFGKYSYGIYVLHALFMPFLLHYFRAEIFAVTHSKLLAVAGAGFMTMAIGIAAAWVSYHLYEKKFLRLKRYFDYNSRSPLPSELKSAQETISA
jgi:peptidoglycan/LPS O-acetylase OafA/YrhL